MGLVLIEHGNMPKFAMAEPYASGSQRIVMNVLTGEHIRRFRLHCRASWVLKNATNWRGRRHGSFWVIVSRTRSQLSCNGQLGATVYAPDVLRAGSYRPDPRVREGAVFQAQRRDERPSLEPSKQTQGSRRNLGRDDECGDGTSGA